MPCVLSEKSIMQPLYDWTNNFPPFTCITNTATDCHAITIHYTITANRINQLENDY